MARLFTFAVGWLLCSHSLAWSQTTIPVEISASTGEPTVTPFVFLVGYDQLDEDGQLMPSMAPVEVHMAGQWVGRWPIERHLSLTPGMVYRAVTSLQDHPTPEQPSSPFVQYTGIEQRLTFQLPKINALSEPKLVNRSKRAVEILIVHEGRMGPDKELQLMVAKKDAYQANGDSVFQGGLDLAVETVGQVLVGHADLEPDSIVLPVLIQHSNNDSTVERGIPNLYDGGQDLVLRFEPNAPTILTSPSPTTVQANPSATSGVVAETPRPQVSTNDQTGFRWTWLAWVVGALSVLTMVVRIRAKR